MTQNRPQTGDYAHYYEKYVALVPGGGFLEILESQLRNTSALLSPLSDSQGDFRYAPGKWSIKETRGHVNDAERIFSYRMLRTARGDQAPLAGFEQDDYVKTGDFGVRMLSDLPEEFSSVLRATITLVDTAAWPEVPHCHGNILPRACAERRPFTLLGALRVLAARCYNSPFAGFYFAPLGFLPARY